MDTSIERRIESVFSRSRNITFEIKNNKIIFNITRKSRFIMKDAKALYDKLNQASVDFKKYTVELKLSSEICSKSTLFLEKYNITIKK